MKSENIFKEPKHRQEFTKKSGKPDNHFIDELENKIKFLEEDNMKCRKEIKYLNSCLERYQNKDNKVKLF